MDYDDDRDFGAWDREDDLADYNDNEADDYRNEGDCDDGLCFADGLDDDDLFDRDDEGFEEENRDWDEIGRE